MKDPRFLVAATVLDSPDTQALAAFYQQLLGWDVIAEDEADWVMLRPAGGGTSLSFQTEPAYVPPVWPSNQDEQQMMTHLDIATDDLAGAVARACDLGASVAECQPQQDVQVMLDPAGHPFCLFEWSGINADD
jgi:predicted enzyme related to lactoylglutathione lyase